MDGTREKSPQNHGFIIPVILVVLSILLVLGFSLHQISKSQFHQVLHSAEREKLYHWANSGLDLTLAALEQTTIFLNDIDPSNRPWRMKAPLGLQPFLNLFLSPSGELDIQERSLVWSPPVPVKDANLKDAPEVEVEIELRGVRPLFSAGPQAGVQVDGRETRFWIYLRSIATSPRGKVSISAFSHSMLVQIQPSILGKFVLLLRGSGALALNSIKDSSEPSNLKGLPLNIFSGDALPPDGSLTMSAAADVIDRRGWIYLGGAGPWDIHLGNGGGREEFASGMMPSSVFHSPIPLGEPLATEAELSYIWSMKGLFPELGSSDSFSKSLERVMPGILEYSTVINLLGTQLRPSPTLVLGSVLIHYALLQGIHNRNSSKTFYLPYLKESEFQGTDWPGGGSVALVQYLKGNFLNEYDRYQKRMSSVESQRINERNLALVDLSHQQSHLDPTILSMDLMKEAESSRIAAGGFPVKFFENIHHPELEIKDNAGKVLFQGRDLENLGDLAFLTARSKSVFPDQNAFLESFAKGSTKKSYAGGITWIQSDLDLEDDLFIELGKGGILIVNDQIRLRAKILSAGREPFTLISLNSGIQVESEGDLQCGLVAMKGEISLPNRIRIHGFVAAKELNLSVGTPAGFREIFYNDRFDPTDFENYENHFRLFLSDAWHRFIE